MKNHTLFVLIALLPVTVVADDASDIGKVIDSFHDAASHGDTDRYLGYMTDDGVFLGTDEWERWPKQPEFVNYVGTRFKDGAGWNYQSVERNIRVADSGEYAWFDEVVYSEQNGRFRGTGVLSKQDGSWKIAHYAMSFLILNENWPDVIELTRKTRAAKESATMSE
jgi:ketosteroid isomerase-like protein